MPKKSHGVTFLRHQRSETRLVEIRTTGTTVCLELRRISA